MAKRSSKEQVDWDNWSLSSMQNSKRSETWVRVWFVLIMIGLFFLITWFVQLAWNYTLPKLVDSIDKDYNPDTDFTSIDYWTAVVLVLLVSLLFGGIWRSSRCNNPCCR